MGIDQNRAIVDDRVAILASTVFLGHIVIGHAGLWELGTHPYITLIAVRRAVLFNYITPETRPLIYAQNPCDAPDDPPIVPPTIAPTGPPARSPSRDPRSMPPGTP
jgi:hypothetical protein